MALASGSIGPIEAAWVRGGQLRPARYGVETTDESEFLAAPTSVMERN